MRLANSTMTKKTGSRCGTAVAAPVNGELPKTIGANYSYDFSWLVREAKAKLDQVDHRPENTANVKIN